MKHGALSVIVSLLGFCFLVYIQTETAQMFETMNAHQQLEPNLIVVPKIYKMATLIIGLIGVFYGIKGRKTAKKSSSIGIALSILLILLSFVPFWTYFVSNA